MTPAVRDAPASLPAPAVPAPANRKQTVILLGPQGEKETLAAVLEEHGLRGRLAVVTAGWQEREGEVQALQDHVAGRAENLLLHKRADEVFAEHPDLEEEHRLRQTRLRQLQRLYNVRVEHAMAAVAELARRSEPEPLIRQAWEAAVGTVRSIDEEHLVDLKVAHREFDLRLDLGQRKAVRRHRREIAKILGDCEVLAIAGGHVAVLLNRLRLFDVTKHIKDKPVIGWAAGAMVLSERVVLYHDSPPQGAGNPEVLEAGLGLVKGVVPLPHARTRLRLNDPQRVSRFATRFAPARCVAMDEGARLTVGPTGWSASPETKELTPDGRVQRMER
ncbi:MAG TPA: Type 1 glutamine amidotransferase-like domain-containing protein [bacterium]|nr:Type 1 glutamine amidotransferase-like domain-containing protein [bacterium]